MATELVARTSQLRLVPLNAQRPEQFRTGIAGKFFRVTTQHRGPRVFR